jgi:hypothetical protein
LRAAGRLQHVKVAIAIPRVERFHGRGDQDVALSCMTDRFAAGGVTDSIGLMQGV